MIAILLLAAVILAGTVVWSSTAASGLVTRESIQGFLTSVADSGWAPLWVLAIFVTGGLIAFPVVVLIAATAATFGPLFGFAYALIGVLASALVTFFIGASVGRNAVRSLLGTALGPGAACASTGAAFSRSPRSAWCRSRRSAWST